MDASIAANSYNCRRNSVNVIAAYQDNYVIKTLDKVWKALNFLNDHTNGGFFKLRQVSDTQYLKKASYYKLINGQKVESGWLSQIQGIIADKPNKIRGDRTDLLIYEEGGCHAPGTKVIMYDGSIKKVEDIRIGDILMGNDGTPRNVIELHSGIDQMFKLIPNNGQEQIVNSNHIIYGKYRDYSKNTYQDFEIKAKDYYEMIQKYPRRKDNYKLIKANKITFKHQDVPIDPYLFGFWLGDGHSADTKFTSKDSEILNFLQKFAENNNLNVSFRDCDNSIGCKHIRFSGKEGSNNWLRIKLKELGVWDNKYIPDCYIYNSREILLQLLAGLIDSDGTYNPGKHEVQITQYEEHKQIIEKATFICRMLGMRVSTDVRISKQRIINGKTIKGGVKQYRLKILYGHSEIPTKIARKQTEERSEKYKSSRDRLACTFKIEKYSIGEYYGFSLDGNQLFLLEDFTVCHNSWPNSTKAFIQGDALVSIQGQKFGIKIIGGTGR